MKNQIKLLKQYGVTNYCVENGEIIINGSLDLSSLTNVDKDFLKGTTINGSLDLNSLTNVDKDFLKGTTINGYLDLNSLTNVDKDFLKGTTINGGLDLSSLTNVDKDFLRKNVKKLEVGYNKDGGYCYFDGILAKVDKVSQKLSYTIYTTPIGYVVQKGLLTAHGKSVKKGIEDLEFKIISDRLKSDPIKCDTIIDSKYYHLVTGSCELGIDNFIRSNNLKSSYRADELLPILEKNNAYGIIKFKSLLSF